MELSIPFRNFVREATPPLPGDLWRLNLNRTGGISNKWASAWSAILAARRSSRGVQVDALAGRGRYGPAPAKAFSL
jgi:hypothetical protein